MTRRAPTSRKSHFRLFACFSILILILLPRIASAELSEEEERREELEVIKEHKRTEREPEVTTSIGASILERYNMLFDYGGTVRVSYKGGSEDDRNSGLVDSLDHYYNYALSGYAQVSDVERQNRFYIRTRIAYTEFKKNGQSSSRGNDVSEPSIDMAYFEKKMPGNPYYQMFRIGRQYVSIGRGIAFAKVADGIFYRMQKRGSKLSYELFALQSRRRDDNRAVYLSSRVPQAGTDSRRFLGASILWRFHRLHRVKIYAIRNSDRNPDTYALSGRIKFDSKYYGAVFTGNITSKLTYWNTMIRERGKNFARGTTSDVAARDNIRAFAWDAGMRYNFADMSTKPTFRVQYSVASGDSRANSPTGTNLTTGNDAGTDDRSFQSFGGLALGYALSPSFSNIRAFQLGGSILTMPNVLDESLKETRLYVTWYTFRMFNTAGAVSDGYVNIPNRSGKLGEEWNVNLQIKLMSDLKSDIRLGHFRPGGAYGEENRSSEDYLRYSITLDI